MYSTYNTSIQAKVAAPRSWAAAEEGKEKPVRRSLGDPRSPAHGGAFAEPEADEWAPSKMSSFGWSARLYVHCIVIIVSHTQLLAVSDVRIHFAALSAGSPLVSERHDSRTVELRCGGWASCRRAPGARLSSQSRSDWCAARPIHLCVRTWYVQGTPSISHAPGLARYSHPRVRRDVLLLITLCGLRHSLIQISATSHPPQPPQ
jgi:hypothetical protein